MNAEKQRQRRRDDLRLTKSRDSKSEQLLVMPTELLLINGEWLLGELLSGSERQTPSWFLDMNIRLARYEISDLFLQGCDAKSGHKAWVCS